MRVEEQPTFPRKRAHGRKATRRVVASRPPRARLKILAPIILSTIVSLPRMYTVNEEPSRRPDENTKYPDEEVLPGDWAKSRSARMGRIRFGRVFYYTINSLNTPGAPPALHRRPPFVMTPYAYKPEHKDSNGSLGCFEWTQLPQYVEDVRYAVPHRAFVTRKPANLVITATRLPKVEEVNPGADEDALLIERDYLRRIRAQYETVRAAYHDFTNTFERMRLPVASTFDFNWAFGDEWTRLMNRSEGVFTRQELRVWTHEVRRRMVDGLAFTEFCLRQLVHHTLYLGAHDQPKWPTESRFTGVMVFEANEHAYKYGCELARLGAPIWTIRLRDQEPPLQIMPPGASHSHPLYRGLRSDAYRRYQPRERAEKEFRFAFEHWGKELIRRNQGTEEEIWWMRERTSRKDLPSGKYYVNPQGMPTPSRTGIKSLFAAHVLSSIKLPIGPRIFDSESVKGIHPPEQVLQRAAFLSQTFGTSILPLKRNPRLGTVPALFQDSRARLQQWAQELFPSLLLPENEEPTMPPRSLTLSISNLLEHYNNTVDLPPTLTLTLVDRISQPEQEPRSTRIRSPEPEDRRLRRRIEGPEYREEQEDRRDLPETWMGSYDAQPQNIPAELATGISDQRNLNLPSVGGHLYLIMEDYPITSSTGANVALLYDRFGSRGARGYAISTKEQSHFTLTLQFELAQQRVVSTILENQTRASQWFPAGEPRRAYLAYHPNQVADCGPWTMEVIRNHTQQQLDREQTRRERFMLPQTPSLPSAFHRDLLGDRKDGRGSLHARLEDRFHIILPTINRQLPDSFAKTSRVDYPAGSSYLVMTRYRIPPDTFIDLLAAQVERLKQDTPLTLGSTLHPLDILLDTLNRLMAQPTPSSFKIPIPPEGFYRDALEGVATRFKAATPPHALGKGSFADELFIYEQGRVEFEITLCDLEWADLFDL